MKVKTIVEFQDIRAQKLRTFGEEFEVSEQRYKEILEVGEFVKPLEEIPIDKEELDSKEDEETLVEDSDNEESKVDYKKMKVSELKDLLKEKNIEFNSSDNKEDLIKLLEG